VLWQQTGAEYGTLCYQAFKITAVRLNEISKRKLQNEHLVIITDLNEIILDNIFRGAQLIKEGREHSNAIWKDWTNKSAAKAVPRALEVLQVAKQKGITIFYSVNRDTSDVQATLINLQNL